jgi:hypothetical protein
MTSRVSERERKEILSQSFIDFDFSFPEFYGSFHANRHAILNNNCQRAFVIFGVWEENCQNR